MSETIYKEKQHFSNKYIYGSLFLALSLVFVRLINEFLFTSSKFWLVVGASSALIIVIGSAIWYYYNLSLKVKVTASRISFKMKPLPARKKSILWNEVDDYEIVTTPEAAQWIGGNITFNHENRFTVCGRNGIHITTKEGQEYFIGSRNLNQLEAAIKKVFG